MKNITDHIIFNDAGLIPVICQCDDSNEVLMLAWMNIDSLQKTIDTGDVYYYSRSRDKIWRKGESSGQYQKLVDLRLDCDGDSLLIKVKQHGVACHTGRRSCFYRSKTKQSWTENQEILLSPKELYGSDK